MKIKPIIIFFLPIIFYLVQTAYPYHLEFFSIKPNILLGYCMGIVLISDMKKHWYYLILPVFLLTISSSLPMLSHLFIIASTVGLVLYLKKIFNQNNLNIYLSLPIACLLFSILIITVGAWSSNYQFDQVADYLKLKSLPEYLLNLIFFTLISYGLKSLNTNQVNVIDIENK